MAAVLDFVLLPVETRCAECKKKKKKKKKPTTLFQGGHAWTETGKKKKERKQRQKEKKQSDKHSFEEGMQVRRARTRELLESRVCAERRYPVDTALLVQYNND